MKKTKNYSIKEFVIRLIPILVFQGLCIYGLMAFQSNNLVTLIKREEFLNLLLLLFLFYSFIEAIGIKYEFLYPSSRIKNKVSLWIHGLGYIFLMLFMVHENILVLLMSEAFLVMIHKILLFMAYHKDQEIFPVKKNFEKYQVFLTTAFFLVIEGSLILMIIFNEWIQRRFLLVPIFLFVCILDYSVLKIYRGEFFNYFEMKNPYKIGLVFTLIFIHLAIGWIIGPSRQGIYIIYVIFMMNIMIALNVSGYFAFKKCSDTLT